MIFFPTTHTWEVEALDAWIALLTELDYIRDLARDAW
jgi:hypothetical protein